ncbi:HD domain-containing protein [Turicibacter sp. TJ11]|uniref:HD domain-containing protein n=1 Tax=Turicibacter sp. TJ11 TaxID=2806443 RepID=UPI001F17A254|nr:HD domain-containing protein [Turicibacter sp. TJ11]
MMERFKKQLNFLIEIDQVKNILRMTSIADGSRRENDAEHSWSLAMMAVLFAEYVDDQIDLLKVIKMVLIHDLVEIHAGDTFCFDEAGMQDKEAREQASADKIFGLLEHDQGQELRQLWEEFESCETLEAEYAAMLDRLQPLIMNYINEGGTWAQHQISVEQVYKRNQITLEKGPQVFKDFIHEVIEECVAKGYIK